LVSEQYGHWLVAFTLQSDDGDWVTMFDQSYDDGKTWMSFPSNISPDFDGDCENPTIATNGEDVCVAWRDDRNGYLEIWVDHGVQD